MGRPPFALEKMVRVYCLQQWFALSDPALEEALYDSESMRRFAGFGGGEDTIPDESTILHFRHLLEAHDLTQTLFDEVTRYLEEQGLLLRRGTGRPQHRAHRAGSVGRQKVLNLSVLVERMLLSVEQFVLLHP